MDDTKNTKNTEGQDKNIPPVEEKKENVSLPKKTLQAILDRIDSLETDKKSFDEREKKRDAEIDMLKSISDKGRLARYESLNQGALIRTVKVAFWDGKPLLAWTRGTDEVGFRDGKLIVHQTIKIFLDEGGETPVMKEVEYLFWAQNSYTQPGEVVEKTETPSGNFWTVQMKDGKKIKVDIRFLNAF